MSNGAAHWADETALRIIREKGEKERYTCASGITPSGTVHVGNFREIISVELVVRALRSLGKNTRFIYSWDDYDVFRKVPQNMPRRETLARYLRFPITMVPDPWERDASYARHHEADVEAALPLVGISPEYLYQTERYRASRYAEGMRKALEKRAVIREILDEFRDGEHKIEGDWWPLGVFCSGCNRDDTAISGWDGEWALSYRCALCGKEETLDLRTARGAKLGWRVDWPMRWAYEGVDFEPAGKDHHSRGGSFDTARRVSKEVYGNDAPVTFRYDFIGIKGLEGKMSSSKGRVIDLPALLGVYTPEIVRYLFAAARPNTEFTISFDLDVIKIYEDYDRTERVAWKLEPAKTEEQYRRERRIYELSQVAETPPDAPPDASVQIPFRHLCSLLQINDMDIEKTLAGLAPAPAEWRERRRARAVCAARWIEEYAPAEFRFRLRRDGPEAALSGGERAALRRLRDDVVAHIERFETEKAVAQAIYDTALACGIEPKALFSAVYRALIGKEQGPRLASFLRAIRKERLLDILAAY